MNDHRGDYRNAAASPPRPDTRPDQPGAVRAQAHAVIAEYDNVRTWSDPPARQHELVRLGTIAIDLLRRLGGEPR